MLKCAKGLQFRVLSLGKVVSEKYGDRYCERIMCTGILDGFVIESPSCQGCSNGALGQFLKKKKMMSDWIFMVLLGTC